MARLPITSLPARAACLCAVVAAGMLPASAAAASCANANLTPTSANVEQVRAAVVCLIDQERERHGEGALAPNAKLARAAQAHSRDMADEDYFSHIAPDGETPLDRMRASGYIPNAQDGYVVGENIAWGTMWLATPQSIVNAWMASPGHRANILDGTYRETGVGVEPRPPAALAEGQPGALYTQDFGTVIPAGHSSRHVAAGSGRITSGTRKQGERSNTHHGSSRRQSRHRHRVRARHRARHRRAARRKRRAGADQRSRRRRRHAGR
ncbi:MAG TPA: CAP domain-containing protein [Solirubrobacteraceae bacterium]|nr:CAP domain-containing protein [Solirubrobacteraceae bacterium]